MNNKIFYQDFTALHSHYRSHLDIIINTDFLSLSVFSLFCFFTRGFRLLKMSLSAFYCGGEYAVRLTAASWPNFQIHFTERNIWTETSGEECSPFLIVPPPLPSHNNALTFWPGSRGTWEYEHIESVFCFYFKNKGAEKPLCPHRPRPAPPHPSQICSHHSQLWHWTLFQGFSSHLSYSLLFPPLFSIFNSAPQWGLCEARHACQREI